MAAVREMAERVSLREPLTRLLALMEEFAGSGALPLNDERVAACYRELSTIVDAHPPASAPPAGASLIDHVDPESGTEWKVKPTDQVGSPGRCRSCQAMILWVRRVPKSGGAAKPHPLDHDGTSHFATCPQAEQWRSG